MKANLTVLVAALVLAGCAAKPTVWTREGAAESDFNADKLRCEYEATAATQSTDPGMRTIIGQELDRAMRKNDLMKLCMRSKGWTERAAG